MVALAAAAPPAPSAVYDNTGSFEINDETREAYILGLGMGYLRGKNIDKHIDGKNMVQLLGEGDLSHRGLKAVLQELGYEGYQYVGNTQDSSYSSGHNVSKRSPVNPVALPYSVPLFPTLKTLGVKTTALGAAMLPTGIFTPSGALFIKSGKLFKTAAAISLAGK